MIAVDTNVLVHASRRESPWHAVAAVCVRELSEAPAAWAIPWPCVHEFLAVVTHPRVFDPPTPLDRALDQVDAWIESPSLTLLGAGPGYWAHLRELALGGRIDGPRFHDAHVAALCLANGVRELWSADRDFARFPTLRIRNPLIGKP